jgi:hypothetical protein
VLGVDAASTLLLFKIEPEYWTIIKPFMLYLNMIPETEMVSIGIDEKVWKTLEDI